jgi:hypothetical protein
LYLLMLRDGLPLWTESAVQAKTWPTRADAICFATYITPPTIPVPIHSVRPAADPFDWEVENG